MKKVILLFALLLAGFVAVAQVDRSVPEFEYSDLQRLTPEDYINMQLPPLHVLFENALQSPQIKYYESNKEIEQRELKNTRRTWQQYVKLNAGYSYGYWDISSQNYMDTSMPVYISTSGRQQNWFNAGASISIPIGEIFNRNNKIKQQKKHVENAQHDVDRWHNELKIKIIEAYTTAIEQLSMLPSAVESMTTANAQYLKTEVDFINGQTDMQGLSRQKNIENVSIREYEQIRSKLNAALLQLEVLSQTRIISRNE